MQNFALSGFSVEHFWQRIDFPKGPRLGTFYHRTPDRDSRPQGLGYHYRLEPTTPNCGGATMADSRRGGALTTMAILFAILAITDILKPFHLEGPTTGLVFFGKRLSGVPDAILGPVLGIILLTYAAGI